MSIPRPVNHRASLSLRQTLLVGTSIGILVPALILAYFQVTDKLANEVNQRVRAPLRQYADILTSGIASPLWNLDPGAAAKQVEAVMRNPDVTRVTVTSSLGGKFVERQVAGDTGTRRITEERAITYNGKPIGNLQMEMSTARVERELWDSIARLVLALTTQIGFSFAFIWLLFDHRVIRPIKALQQSALRLAQGQLDEPVVSQRRDEIGSLAKGLDTMRADLASLIADRDQKNAELARHRDHLEEQIRVRTQALHDAVQEADTANRAKSVFLSNMSHELRTPLNAILGFARMLERDHDIRIESRQKLATINRAGQHLLEVINDVLEISRIEARRVVINREPFDLPDLLLAVAELADARAEDKGLAFVVEHAPDLPRHVVGDAPHIKQILVNLLGNAVKYTDHGSVRFHASRSGNEVSFAVSDTGRGISPEEQKKLFEAFYQTDSAIARGEGTGLGLTISFEYARLMEGRLEVSSRLHQGSVFTLRVPLAETGEPVSVPAPRRAVNRLEPGQEGLRILVVDDKEDNQNFLRQLLEVTGFEVRTADNGQFAVQVFQEWRPHFIWMDVRMPVMDGYQATRMIRALPGGQEVKIVALTASVFEEDRKAVMEAGCDEMAVKPIEEERLFEVMGRQLGLRYNYIDEAPVAASAAADPSLAALPAGVVDGLRAAAEALDLDAIRKMEATLRVGHPDVAAMLATMVTGYRFDQIVELCKRQTRS